MTLVFFCSWAGRFESYLVANPWRQFLSWHSSFVIWVFLPVKIISQVQGVKDEDLQGKNTVWCKLVISNCPSICLVNNGLTWHQLQFKNTWAWPSICRTWLSHMLSPSGIRIWGKMSYCITECFLLSNFRLFPFRRRDLCILGNHGCSNVHCLHLAYVHYEHG